MTGPMTDGRKPGTFRLFNVSGERFSRTIDALKLSQRPVSRIILPQINAHTIAQVLYLLEVETAMAGRLYNVNTFDQPGVEDGKKIARKLMGGEG